MASGTHTRQRRVRISEAGNAIARRETFVAGDGSLSGGYPGSSPFDAKAWGRMPADAMRAFAVAVAAHGAALYVVWSYGTPIAWGTVTDPLTVPTVRYSVTTSKHQGIARRA